MKYRTKVHKSNFSTTGVSMMAGMNGLVNGKSERKPAVARDLAMVPKTAEGNKPYICKGKVLFFDVLKVQNQSSNSSLIHSKIMFDFVFWSSWNLILKFVFSLWTTFY